jgi:hypothetical protein
MAAALALPAALLLATPHWAWPVAAVAAFVAPAVVLLGTAGVLEGRHSWWRAGLAAARLIVLTWLALLALAPARPLPPEQTA